MKKLVVLFLMLIFSTQTAVIAVAASEQSKYPNLELPVSTNMPIESIYYDYIEKLGGLGYVDSMMYGARPYSRLDMARWTLEAKAKSADKKLPEYAYTMLQELEKELAQEIANIENPASKQKIKLHTVSMETAFGDFNENGYSYNKPNTSFWYSFSDNNQGHHYQDGTNVILNAYISGNLGSNAALSVSPNFSWDEEEDFEGVFDEIYVVSEIGIFKIEIGKQALVWGQGVTGNLVLSNNAEPRTMFKVATEEIPQPSGLLSFMGKSRWTGFVARLDGGRADKGVHDYNHPYLVGLRGDFSYDNFTVGLSRVSMLGGDGNAFTLADTGDWLIGKNAYSNDKWNDIAGIDFRYRFPKIQLYGEFYGEDQANYLPSKMAYRGGIYIPAIGSDGSWSLKTEYANTGEAWYGHSTYQTGWTYHEDIMGDVMGCDASKYYLGVSKYLNAQESIGLNGMYIEQGERSGYTPKIAQYWLEYMRKLSANNDLNFMIGVANLRDVGYQNVDDSDVFVKIVWQQRY